MEKMEKMEVPTRIAEESRLTEVPEELPPLSDIESDDDELELSNFNIMQAKDDLYNLQGCYKIMVDTKVQKKLGIQVGINISEEFPWKRIKLALLKEHLFDEIKQGEMIEKFFAKNKPDDWVLLGYAPSVVEIQEDTQRPSTVSQRTNATDVVPAPDVEQDSFVIYVNERDARTAASIIKNIETYERLMMHKKLNKKPRAWLSKGSENEVDLGIPVQKSEVVDVEIQTVYPIQQSDMKLGLRLTSDVRDGYAELIAGEARFYNVTRQRIHVGTQSAPATVTLEQQTDPTFPSNAWCQYFYEIKEGDEGLDESSEDEQEKLEKEKPKTPASKTPTPVVEKPPKPTPVMSDQIKYLLGVLEFNQIDMYRNDYPKIATAPIQIFTNPYLEEIFCFANIAKSNKRYVAAVDWYPHMTGIVVASYTFTTKVTQNRVQKKERVDEVQRSILQHNPVLMWSFTDSLDFKLEFEAPREITALSFCPYDKDILIGGAINGQIIIWDLQGRTQNLDKVEHLTPNEVRNRQLVNSFLNWTILYDEGSKVIPAAISALDGSQTSAITEIRWMSRKHYISSQGRIHEILAREKSRFFCTLSLDGSVAYWNLDYDVGSMARIVGKSGLPMVLVSNESVYKKLDRLIKPTFTLTYSEALTTLICDEAKYNYFPQIDGSGEGGDFLKSFPVEVIEEKDGSPWRNTFIVGTFFGRIECITFEGVEAGALPKLNISNSAYSFAKVHDGPIFALKKNPFFPEIFVSVGRTIFCIWKEDFNFTPILWRERPTPLTTVEWSYDRPSVLYLARNDGSFEVWDFLARDDDACLIEVLGGGIITALSENRACVSRKVISLGDYDSSFRMIVLPESFYKQVPDELQLLKDFVEKEVNRKKAIQNWQQNWRIENADIIEENKKSKAAAERDLENLRLQEEAKKKKQTEEKKEEPPLKSAAHYDFAEKLDKKWDELNLKRLIRNLMARKKVDPKKLQIETAMEKERLNYVDRKQAAVRLAMSKVSEEIAAIRARLLPVEKPDVLLSDMIAKSVKNILKISPTYANVELEAQEYLDEAPPVPDISYDEIMHRCRHRRQLLNKVLGVPTERTNYCEKLKNAAGFKDWDFGDAVFIQSREEYQKRLAESNSQSGMPHPSYSDLDLIPTRDS